MVEDKQIKRIYVSLDPVTHGTLHISKGFVTEEFLLKFGFFNCDIVSLVVNFNSDPFKVSSRGLGNPLPGVHELHQKKPSRIHFLRLDTINVLHGLDYFSSSVKLPSLSNDTIYVSHLTAFNICKRNPVLYQNLIEGGRCSAVLGEAAFNGIVLEEAVVTPIQLPFNIPEEMHDEVLVEFFKIPQFLNLGDMFSVTLDDKQLRQLGFVGQKVSIYFSVISLKKNGQEIEFGFITKPNSTLKSQGICNAYILPCNKARIFNAAGPCRTLDIGQHSNGRQSTDTLFSSIKKIQKLIISLLYGSQPSDMATILFGEIGAGKGLLIKELCSYFGMHLVEINCYSIAGDSISATEKRIKNTVNQSSMYAPSILLLQNIDALCKGKDGEDTEFRLCRYLLDTITHIDKPVYVVGTAFCDINAISAELLRTFNYTIHIGAPNEEERTAILKHLFSLVETCSCVEFSLLSKRCPGAFLGDLKALASFVFQSACARLNGDQEVSEKCMACRCMGIDIERMTLQHLNLDQVVHKPILRQLDKGIIIGCSDFEQALQKLVDDRADKLYMPKVPQVKWDDIGGLISAKKEIMDTIQVPLQYPELVAKGLQRSGILFYGPPGCGKTLLAKAVATELKLNFMSVNGPEVLNMYVGQSEENVRNVFSRARNATPCIIFFDELDSLAPQRGRSGDSGGVMDRVVSQLLAELDGLHSEADIFVIGATNRPDLLDKALLRPGRFDKSIYVGISETKQDRLRILQAIAHKMNLDTDVNLEQIEDSCPAGLSGADFSSLCSDATLNAYRRAIRVWEEKGIVPKVKGAAKKVFVGVEDFQTAIRSLKPSISK